MTTILPVTEHELKALEQQSKLPLYSVQDKYNQFQAMKKQISTLNNFQGIQKTDHLKMLIQQFKKKKSKIDKIKKQQQVYLKPEQFKSVFNDLQPTKQTRQEQQNEVPIIYNPFQSKKCIHSLSQKYYQRQSKNYFQTFIQDYDSKPLTYNPELKLHVPDSLLNLQGRKYLKNLEIPTDLNKFRQIHKNVLNDQLKKLNIQFEELEIQQDQMLRKAENAVYCTNMKIIEKLAPNILNHLNVYQKEIQEMILDDMLTEEVIKLNIIERRKKEQVKIMEKSKHKSTIAKGLPKEAFELMVNLENFIDEDSSRILDESGLMMNESQLQMVSKIAQEARNQQQEVNQMILKHEISNEEMDVNISTTSQEQE